MAEPAHDYSRTTYGGKVVNARTKAMLEEAALYFGRNNGWTLTQGSYNKGVSASAGTHDGGGVVDISVSGMTSEDRAWAVQCLRMVGFFAWLREPPAFSYHIHAVAIGDRELSPAAKSQENQGFRDLNGLADAAKDNVADPYPVWVDFYGTHPDREVAPPLKISSYVPFPGEGWFKDEPRSPIVTAMGKRLVAEGCGLYEEGPGPQWSDADRRSYAKWQLKCGFTGDAANGWPGKTSWDKLKVPE